MDSLRWSSIKLGTIQRILAWPLRNDDTHTSRSVNISYVKCKHIFGKTQTEWGWSSGPPQFKRHAMSAKATTTNNATPKHNNIRNVKATYHVAIYVTNRNSPPPCAAALRISHVATDTAMEKTDGSVCTASRHQTCHFVNVRLPRLRKDLRAGSISLDIGSFPSELCTCS